MEEEVKTKVSKEEYKSRINKICSTLKAINDKSGEYEAIKLYPFQEDIIYEIVTKEYKFVHCLVCTRGGKSFSVSMGVLISAMINDYEEWLIIAPTKDKAQIIMGNIRSFIASNPMFDKMIPKTFKTTSDKLIAEKSRESISFKNGSRITILSADVKNKQAAGQALMGKGSQNIVIDESAEIPDYMYSKIFRMTTQTSNPFLIELGNPWFRNHFWRCSKDSGQSESKYFHHLFFNDEELVKQGRFTWEQLEIPKLSQDYDVLFACRFPDADTIDKDGYMSLFTRKFIDDHMTENAYLYGNKRLGVDVSYSGADKNSYVLRGDNLAKIIRQDNVKNPTETIQAIVFHMNQFSVSDRNVYIDGTAGGSAFVDSVKNMGYIGVHGINFGEKAIDSEKYANRKAEGYFKLKEWMSRGGMLLKDESWYQLENIKYMPDGTGRIKIISKQELRKQGIHSPDAADALMLTCFGGITGGQKSVEKRIQSLEEKRNKSRRFN